MTNLQTLSPANPTAGQPVYTHDYREFINNPICYQLFEYDYAYPERSAHWPQECQHPMAAQAWLASYAQDDTERFLALCQLQLQTDPQNAAQTLTAMAEAMAVAK